MFLLLTLHVYLDVRIAALEKLTAQHADTLTRALTELREVGDIESAEAEVYAARTSADQRVATAEARLAEEIQRRRDPESERADAARRVLSRVGGAHR